MPLLKFVLRLQFGLIAVLCALGADYRPDPNVYHTVDRYNRLNIIIVLVSIAYQRFGLQ